MQEERDEHRRPGPSSVVWQCGACLEEDCPAATGNAWTPRRLLELYMKQERRTHAGTAFD